MNKVTRAEILAQASRKLRSDFEGLVTVPHSALRGQQAEQIIKEFLKSHLPKRFGVGGGFVLDGRDYISRQNDVIVYDAHNCPVFRASDDAGIYPANNVAAVIEVKSSIDGRNIEDAWDKIAEIKGLARDRYVEGPDFTINKTMGILFGYSSSITLDTIEGHYRRLFKEKGIGHHLDVIVLLDQAIIMLAGKPQNNEWAPMILAGSGGQHSEGTHLATSIHEFREDTLDAFLRILLTQLTHFRPIVDHPGYSWSHLGGKGKMEIRYLTSLTNEADPVKADILVEEYARQALLQFDQMNQLNAENESNTN